LLFFSGLKGIVSTAVIKDVKIMSSMAFFGIYLLYHYCGGIDQMFAKVEAIKGQSPNFL